MWKDLGKEWQIAFEEAWKAFSSGSVPIGAALFSESGTLVGRDRNRGEEAGTINRKISHAEANVLRNLDTEQFPDPKHLKLYTTMEPCPMCVGTIVMANIRDVNYAAADTYCGAVHLLKEDPYMKSKHIVCRHVGGEHEVFQITLQSLYEIKRIKKGHSAIVLESFEKSCPKAVALAKELLTKNLPDIWTPKTNVADVYDTVCAMASELAPDKI